MKTQNKLVIRLGVIYDAKGNHVAFARHMGGPRQSDDGLIEEAQDIDRMLTCPQSCIVEVTVFPPENVIGKLGKVKTVEP